MSNYVSGEIFFEPLSPEKTLMYFEKYKNGDKTARDEIIVHNTRLVFYVTKKYSNIKYDFEDLFSVGLMGLLKAIDTFDSNKNVLFSTYASHCINNEILVFLRRMRKHKNDVSLETTTFKRENFEIPIEICLEDENINIESDFINDECMTQVMSMVSTLPEGDQKILTMYFGLNSEKRYNQEEIAKYFNISQSYTSRKIRKILEEIKMKCIINGILEYNSNLFEGKRKVKRK